MFCHFLRQGTLRCVITVRRRSAVMIYEIVLFFLFFFPQLIAGIFLRVATSHGGVPTRLAIRCGRSAVLNAGGNFLLGAPAGRAGAAAGRSGAERRGAGVPARARPPRPIVAAPHTPRPAPFAPCAEIAAAAVSAGSGASGRRRSIPGRSGGTVPSRPFPSRSIPSGPAPMAPRRPGPAVEGGR